MRFATSELLGLIQIGKSLALPLELLEESISYAYPSIQVKRMLPMGEPADAYDSRRNQYHSTRILAQLEQGIRNMSVERLLGVTNFDLFVPGLNFVFGEARLPGRVGVISTYRLKTSPRRGVDLFNGRVEKEAVHEIGHMMGLEHCSDRSCVMYFSNTLADTDHKSRNLCRKCKSRLSVQIEQ